MGTVLGDLFGLITYDTFSQWFREVRFSNCLGYPSFSFNFIA
jgi:hypothetical protein